MGFYREACQIRPTLILSIYQMVDSNGQIPHIWINESPNLTHISSISERFLKETSKYLASFLSLVSINLQLLCFHVYKCGRALFLLYPLTWVTHYDQSIDSGRNEAFLKYTLKKPHIWIALHFMLMCLSPGYTPTVCIISKRGIMLSWLNGGRNTWCISLQN